VHLALFQSMTEGWRYRDWINKTNHSFVGRDKSIYGGVRKTSRGRHLDCSERSIALRHVVPLVHGFLLVAKHADSQHLQDHNYALSMRVAASEQTLIE